MEPRIKLIDSILQAMAPEVTELQLEKLQRILYIKADMYEIQERCTEVAIQDHSSEGLLRRFLAAKRLEGKAESTIRQYYLVLSQLIHGLRVPIHEVGIYDLRFYFSVYKEQHKVGNRTLDNMRKYCSSFFGWLSDEGLIGENPARGLKSIKYIKTVKQAFSDEERELLKNSCENLRDLALTEVLYASGLRVSELVSLNRNDIDFISREAVVLGKGGKERRFYLSRVSCLYLKRYLETRKDTCPALFTGLRAPARRLTKNGVEAALRRLGRRAEVEKVHPHRYRRTLATNLIDRGANIQDVQQILGHADIRTTQIYYCVNQERVRHSYEKYVA